MICWFEHLQAFCNPDNLASYLQFQPINRLSCKTTVIGIDIGGTMIKGALFDSDGALVQKRSVETRVDRGRDAVLQNLTALIKFSARQKGRCHLSALVLPASLIRTKEVLLQSPNIKAI